MKIGVLTLRLHTNYGGILQAYALQTILKRMGHEAILIDTVKWELRLSPFRLNYWRYIIRSRNTRLFVTKYIRSIRMEELSKVAELHLDAIIVGSDQVWRPIYFGNIEDAFLDFAKDYHIKKVAYATSFGTERWEYTPEQTRRCTELIRKFDAVSVREESGQLLCREYFQIEAELLLDPTMLLSVRDYYNLIKKLPTLKIKNLLSTYILDKNTDKLALIQLITNTHRFDATLELGVPTDDLSLPLLKRIQPPVEHWIQGLYDATFVVTDSFHGCIFSILFHKPFIAYGNSERGMARFHSLLKLFDLEERIVFSSEEFSRKEFRLIDWGRVDARLNELRNKSTTFLKQALL